MGLCMHAHSCAHACGRLFGVLCMLCVLWAYICICVYSIFNLLSLEKRRTSTISFLFAIKDMAHQHNKRTQTRVRTIPHHVN